MSHTILTTCILAHLNNIVEPGSFNKHLNFLLQKNLPEFTAEDYAPSHKIFKVASLYRTVTPSQEALNDKTNITRKTSRNHSSKAAISATATIPTNRPKERRQVKKKQTPIIPDIDLGLVVHASETRPFPGSITYDHLKDHIIKEKYKVTGLDSNIRT